MDKAKQFMQLKERWKQASEAERPEIDKQISALLNSVPDEEMPALEEAVSEDLKRVHNELDDIEQTITIRKQMEPILHLLSISAFAKEYFGKSSSWFQQRMNGNVVHGRPASFTNEERAQLQSALKDLSERIANVNL